MASAATVSSLYKSLLGRAPDAGGLKHYMGYGSDAAIKSSIMSSAEYKKRAASSKAKPKANPLQTFANQQKKQYNSLLARQKKEQEGLFGQYTDQLQGQEQLPDLYNRLQEEAGIPEATAQLQTYKDQIYRTKDLLDRLDEDVTSRNLGTYTTEAMRNRIMASESEDLNTTLSRLGTGMAPVVDLLTGAQSQVGNLMPLYMQQQDKELQPTLMRINALGDRFAREITGFSQNRENQLTAIMDKLERERQLADREWELAQQLAAEERAYSRQRSLAAQQLSNLGSYFQANPKTPPSNTQANQKAIKQLPPVSGLQWYGPGLGKPASYTPPLLQQSNPFKALTAITGGR